MSSFGERLASIRKRRGLTQHELAAESGVSVSLIRMLEQGHQETTRSETARKLAVALRVPTSALMPQPIAAGPASSAGDWEAVQRALEGRRISPEPEDPPTLEGVAATLESYKPLMRSAAYTELRAGLPALLQDADYLVSNSTNGARVEARRLRSRVRQVTGWLMTQTWQFEAADHAMQLALDDAPDLRVAVPVVDSMCWRYIRQGDFTSARSVASKWADDIEPIRISRASNEDLSAWGRVLLRVSTAAVRDNRPGEADDAMRLAHMAAQGLNRREHTNEESGALHTFGPLTVAMIEAENAMVVDKPDVTLAMSTRLEGRQHPVPWVWNRHRLDVANAHVAMRQHGEAVTILGAIRSELPEWLMTQRYARDVLGRIIEKRRTLSPEMRELADFISVPY